MSCITHIIKHGDTLYQLSRTYGVSIEDILNGNPHINPYNPYGLQIGMTLNICTTNNSDNGMSDKDVLLLTEMNKLWSQHVHWTRSFLISVAENLRDLEPTKTRLLQNPKDFGNLFRQHYNNTVGDKIQDLLTEHLTIGGDLIVALKNGNTNQARILNEHWYKNADEIAEYLASINPNYNKEELRKMLHKHLELLTNQVSARLRKNYSEDIKWYDEGEKEALNMADYFARGIIKQKK